MGFLTFIAALAVGITVMVWYFVNEAKGADGSVGLLALRGRAGADDGADAPEAARYRPRQRMTPARGGRLENAATGKTYRAKAPPRPDWAEDDLADDEDY